MDTLSTPGDAGERPALVQNPKGAPSPLGIATKALRTERALSQRALSRASGVPQSVISNLESGVITITETRTVEALAQALECSPDDLLRGAATAPPAAPPEIGARLIPHNRLQRSHLNPRKVFDDTALDDLAASLREDGILQNLLVRADPDAPDGFLVIAGERRWRAAGRLVERGEWADDHPIPCLIVEADEVKHRLLAIVENLQRVQVDPLDEAETYREMLAYGEWDTAAIGSAIGKSARHVQLRVALLNRLDETAQQALRSREINLATARALTAAPLVLQREMLDRISRGDPSLRRAEDIASQIRAALFPASRALFALDRYQGETATDAVNDETLLLDVEQARTLQLAAIEEKIEALRRRFDWVNVMRHNDWWTPGGGDRIIYAADRPDTSGAALPLGAVVRVAGNLEVTVFEKLVAVARATSPTPSTDGDAAHSEPEDGTPAAQPDWSPAFPTPMADPVGTVSLERRLLAVQAKTRALQTGLLVHPDAWAHQLILALLDCRDVCGIVAPPPRPETAVVAPEVAAVLQRFRDQLGGDDTFVPMGDWPYLSLVRDDEHATSTTQAALAVLPRLQALPADESLRLLSALTASRCSTPWIPMRANLGDGPLVLATATAVGAAVGLGTSPITDAYLDTLTADQLERLAADTGASDDVEAFSALNRKGRHKLILDHIAANDVRFVPPEMQFGDAATIEAALRSEAEEEASCTITGLDDLLPADWVERLSVAVAAHPDFGLIGLPLEFGESRLLLMKEPHLGGPVVYSAETFNDGFGAPCPISRAPRDDVQRFVEFWLTANSSAMKDA